MSKLDEIDARIKNRMSEIDRKVADVIGSKTESNENQAAPSDDTAAAGKEAEPVAERSAVPVAQASAASDNAGAPVRSAEPARSGKGSSKGSLKDKIAKILSVFDNGLEIPNLFTIPGIVMKVIFILSCLSVFFHLIWVIRYCCCYSHHSAYYDGVGYYHGGGFSFWWVWPLIVEAAWTYFIYWICARNNKK